MSVLVFTSSLICLVGMWVGLGILVAHSAVAGSLMVLFCGIGFVTTLSMGVYIIEKGE